MMINCGGCFNILELLQPEDDVKFYIVDRYFVEVVTIIEPLISPANGRYFSRTFITMDKYVRCTNLPEKC